MANAVRYPGPSCCRVGAKLRRRCAGTEPGSDKEARQAMTIIVKPTSVSTEKWMRVAQPGGLTLFEFSGFAQFVWGQNPILGIGGNDFDEQKIYQTYEIQDLVVGPHWLAVRQVCPSAVAGGHDQLAPDEADGMGYEVTAITRVRLLNLGGFSRLELRVACKVRGGNQIDAYGAIPSVASRVSALGRLAAPVGTEGVVFGAPNFREQPLHHGQTRPPD